MGVLTIPSVQALNPSICIFAISARFWILVALVIIACTSNSNLVAAYLYILDFATVSSHVVRFSVRLDTLGPFPQLNTRSRGLSSFYSVSSLRTFEFPT
jgi:hypothetical protein